MYAHKRASRLSSIGQVRNALRTLLDLREPALSARREAAASLACSAALALGLDPARAADVAIACELSDVGRLAQGEQSDPREHPIASQQILEAVPALARVAKLVRIHHERIDGSGFPDHLAGSELSLDARIVISATALAELREPAGADEAMSSAQALATLSAQGNHDPEVLAALSA